MVRNDVVFLDDLGKERASEDVATVIYELVDGLLTNERTLIASANLDVKEYAARYDDATRSRIREMCETWRLDGDDRRRTMRPRYRS